MNEVEFLLSLLVGLCFLAVCVMVATIQQWRSVNSEARLRAIMLSMRGTTQPAVTVLVYIHSAAQAFEDTVRSIRKNRHGVVDIVLVDDTQSTEVRRRVSTVKGVHKVLQKRARTTRIAALHAGYQKSKKGEIVIVIDGGETVDVQFSRRLLALRGARESWVGETQTRLTSDISMDTLTMRLEELLWHQHHEVHAYTKRAFLRMDRSGEGFDVSKALLAVNCTFLAALLFGAAYVAGPQLLWYAWVILTTYCLVIVWFRFGDSLQDRIALTLSVPLALILVPAAGAVRGISQGISQK